MIGTSLLNRLLVRESTWEADFKIRLSLLLNNPEHADTVLRIFNKNLRDWGERKEDSARLLTQIISRQFLTREDRLMFFCGSFSVRATLVQCPFIDLQNRHFLGLPEKLAN